MDRADIDNVYSVPTGWQQLVWVGSHGYCSNLSHVVSCNNYSHRHDGYRRVGHSKPQINNLISLLVLSCYKPLLTNVTVNLKSTITLLHLQSRASEPLSCTLLGPDNNQPKLYTRTEIYFHARSHTTQHSSTLSLVALPVHHNCQAIHCIKPKSACNFISV